jgi:hypothetical protein
MSFLRMAGQALKPLLRGTGELIPKGNIGRLMTFGPDAAFALASAAAAPEGTPLLDRAGIAAVDALGFGLLPSFGSRALARAGARRFAGVTDPEKLENIMQVAEMGGQMAPVLLGMQNPLLNSAFERAANTQQQLEADQLATEQRRQDEALLGSLALGTGMAASGLTPRAAQPIGDLFGYGGFG